MWKVTIRINSYFRFPLKCILLFAIIFAWWELRSLIAFENYVYCYWFLWIINRNRSKRFSEIGWLSSRLDPEQLKRTRPKMLRIFIDKYKTLKSEYLNRSPNGKWLFVRNIGIFILKLIGVPVFDPNFEVSALSYCSGLICVGISLSAIYTLWYFMKTPTPINGILVIPIYAVLIPVN